MKLGRLQEVNITELWQNDPSGFATWLADSENIEVLNEETGLKLSNVQLTQAATNNQGDLFAFDQASQQPVIIQNQFNFADAQFLGKLILSAAGLNAGILIWIAKEADSAHRAAIQWLNQHTQHQVKFYLIGLKAFRIGDSLPAPVFTIIESPEVSAEPLFDVDKETVQLKPNLNSTRLTASASEFSDTSSDAQPEVNPSQVVTSSPVAIEVAAPVGPSSQPPLAFSDVATAPSTTAPQSLELTGATERLSEATSLVSEPISKAPETTSPSKVIKKKDEAYLKFWTQFNEVVVQKGQPFNIRKAKSHHWYNIALGTSKAHVGITLILEDNQVGIEIYIGDSKDLFDKLFDQKEMIELLLGFPMEWQRNNDSKVSRIIYYIDGLNFGQETHYQSLMNEIVDKTVIIRDVYKKFI